MTDFKPNVTKSIDNLNQADINVDKLNIDFTKVFSDETKDKIDDIYENNIASRTGTNITLANTVEDGKIDYSLLGDTKQDTAILPEEYQQVEYIESTGTQYIDTGFKPNQDTSIEIDCLYNPDTIKLLFGTREVIGPTIRNSVYFGRISTLASMIAYYNNEGSSNINLFNYRRIYKFEKNKFYIDNDLIYEFTYNNFQTLYNLSLFALNSNGVVDFNCDATLYSGKIWDNNTLIRYFVPCYRKSDGVIGLYDLVNNIFYTNAGTGTFTKGSDVSIPNPEYPQEVQTVTGEQTVTISDGTNSQEYTIDLGDNYLARIPNTDYTDSIVKDGDNWKVVRNIGKGLISIRDYYSSSTKRYAFWLKPTDALDRNKYTTNALSEVGITGTADANNYAISYDIGQYTDEEVATLCNGKEFYYVLAEQTEETITDTDLIEELNDLYDASLYEDETNISSSGNLPTILDVTFFKKAGD